MEAEGVEEEEGKMTEETASSRRGTNRRGAAH